MFPHNINVSDKKTERGTVLQSNNSYIILHVSFDVASSYVVCRSCILKEKQKAKVLKIVISNPFQSSPSSAILVPLWFRITLWWFSSLANHYFWVTVSQHFNRNLGHPLTAFSFSDVRAGVAAVVFKTTFRVMIRWRSSTHLHFVSVSVEFHSRR